MDRWSKLGLALAVIAVLGVGAGATVSLRTSLNVAPASSAATANTDTGIPQFYWQSSLNPGTFYHHANGIDYPTNDIVYSALAYGADPTGATDSTTAFQNALNAATAAGGMFLIPAGTYKSNQLTYTGANRVDIRGTAGTNINTTASTWLKIAPTAGNTAGVRIHSLTFNITSGNAAMTPIIWLEGGASGGITSVDLDDLTFYGGGTYLSPHPFDCIWLRGTFNGKVSRIFGWNLYASRGIVAQANGIYSGNIHYDTITLVDAAIEIEIDGSGGTAGAGTAQVAEEQSLLSNIKSFRTDQGGATVAAAYNEITLTAAGALGATTLTVSVADATTVNTHLTNGDPQWVVAADATNYDQAIQITAANTSTGVLTLATGLRYAIGNGAVLGVGTFGVVMGWANGVQLNDHHCEVIGACEYTAATIHVTSINSVYGASNKRGMVVTDGARNSMSLYPWYGVYAPLTLMEITAQGTNSNNVLYAPASVTGGSPGPGTMIVDAQTAGANNNIYTPTAGIYEIDNLITSSKPAITAYNGQASTAGVPVQYSPIVKIGGRAWNTTAVADQLSAWGIYDQPGSGASISSTINFGSSENNGDNYTTRFSINSFGNAIAAGALFAGGSAGTGAVDADSFNPGSASQTMSFCTSTNCTQANIGNNGNGVSIQGLLTTAPPFKMGGAIASAATIAPTTPIVHVTGTTTITTITAPTAMAQTNGSGCVRLIPDGLWATGTSGNIAIASTAVVSKVLEECWDNVTSKWYPSY